MLKPGETYRTENVTITVSKIQRSTKTKLSPDIKAAGALVKSCVLSVPGDADHVAFTWDPWTAVGPDSESYPAANWQTVKTPEYPNDTDRGFDPGDCVKGWIVFDTSGDQIVGVHYQNSVGEEADWSIA